MPFAYPEIGTRQNEGQWTAISGGADLVLRLLVKAYDAEVHPEHYKESAPDLFKDIIGSRRPQDFEDLRAAFKLDEERKFIESAEWEMEKRVIAEEYRQRDEREADGSDDEDEDED